MGQTKQRMLYKMCCKLAEELETVFSGNHTLFSGMVLFNPLSSVCLPCLITNLMLHGCPCFCPYFLSMTEKEKMALSFCPVASWFRLPVGLGAGDQDPSTQKDVGDKTGFTRGNSDLDYHFLRMIYVCLISYHSDRFQTGRREEFTATEYSPARIWQS